MAAYRSGKNTQPSNQTFVPGATAHFPNRTSHSEARPNDARSILSSLGQLRRKGGRHLLGGEMRSIRGLVLSIALATALTMLARGQQSGTATRSSSPAKGQVTEHEAPLVLTETIPLENAKGRFDHFAMGGGK